MTILTGTTLFARLLARHRARRAMGWLLLRRDDRLLDDIGIRRDELAAELGWPRVRCAASGDFSPARRLAWLPLTGWAAPGPSGTSAATVAAVWPLPCQGVRP